MVKLTRDFSVRFRCRVRLSISAALSECTFYDGVRAREFDASLNMHRFEF